MSVRRLRELRGYYRINRQHFPLTRRAAFLDAWRLWRRTADA